MPLSYPMHAVPGELLVTTENAEDVDYNELWRVPRSIMDDSGVSTPLNYGEFLLVIATWPTATEEPDVTFWPTLLFHTKTQRLIYVPDIEQVGWIWRPDPQATEWKRNDA